MTLVSCRKNSCSISCVCGVGGRGGVVIPSPLAAQVTSSGGIYVNVFRVWARASLAGVGLFTHKRKVIREFFLFLCCPPCFLCSILLAILAAIFPSSRPSILLPYFISSLLSSLLPCFLPFHSHLYSSLHSFFYTLRLPSVLSSILSSILPPLLLACLSF